MINEHFLRLLSQVINYKTGRLILELLQDIVRKEGQTMVIVTHTTPIASMANRVITLKNGKIQKEKVNEHPIDAKDIEW